MMTNIILNNNSSFSSQVTVENAIYEIRYDFTLGGVVTLPENCILKFRGGSVKDGKLENPSTTTTYVIIESYPVPIFYNVEFGGLFTAREIYSEWFGTNINAPDNTNAADGIQKALDVFKCVKLLPKKYELTHTITMGAKCTIEGSKGTTIYADFSNSTVFDLFHLGHFSDISNLRVIVNAPKCHVFVVDAYDLKKTQDTIGIPDGYTTGNTGIHVHNVDVLTTSGAQCNNPGDVIRLISDGRTEDNVIALEGFWGCTFSDMTVFGPWKHVVYMDNGAAQGNTTLNCWITDCLFSNIVCYGCLNFLYIGRNHHESGHHVTNKISNHKFVDCSLQYIAGRSQLFVELDAASRILFYRCLAWDWAITAVKINPQQVDNIKYIHCDEAFSSISRYMEFATAFPDASNEYPIASIDLDRPYIPSYYITPQALGYGTVSALTVGKIRELPYGEYVIPNVLYSTWNFFGFTISGFGYDSNPSAPHKVIFRKKDVSARIYLEFEFWGYTYSRASTLIENSATNNTAITDWKFEPKV